MKYTKKCFVVSGGEKTYTFISTKLEAPVREKVLVPARRSVKSNLNLPRTDL